MGKTEQKLLDDLRESPVGSVVAQGTREVRAAYKLAAAGIVTTKPCGSSYTTKDRNGNARRNFLPMVQIHATQKQTQ